MLSAVTEVIVEAENETFQQVHLTSEIAFVWDEWGNHWNDCESLWAILVLLPPVNLFDTVIQRERQC